MVILISEDNKDLRFILSRILEEKGSTVYTAANGEDALKILNLIGPIDVLVTDFNMPKMNGDELIREALKQRIQIKRIVVMSGKNENEKTVISLLKIHPNITFISKPANTSKLLMAIFG